MSTALYFKYPKSNVHDVQNQVPYHAGLFPQISHVLQDSFVKRDLQKHRILWGSFSDGCYCTMK